MTISIRSIGMLILCVMGVIIVILSQHYVYAETLNRVVAIVNEEVITLHELNKKMREMTGLRPEDLKLQDENKYLEARRLILNRLIDDKISRKKIAELGIMVAPKQIDAAIERIKSDNQWTHEDLLSALKKSGTSYETYRNNIKKDLERFKLINFEVRSKIIIREEQIIQYYNRHKAEFNIKGTVHLASIFLVRKNPEDEDEMSELHGKAKDILTRLREGQDFGALAREFSQGPGADEGGDLGSFKTSDLEPKLQKILETMPEGGISDLIIRTNGIQIIKLIKKQAGKERPFEEVRNAIYAILLKEEIDKRYKLWINELRERSYTKIIF